MTHTDPKLTQLRWIRVGAILTALVVPWLLYVLRAPSDEVMDAIFSLFVPSLRRVLLLGALGFQIFRIFKPAGEGAPRTLVLSDSTPGHEIRMAIFSLFLTITVQNLRWSGIPQLALPFVYYGADIISVLLLVAWRGTTIIDGDAKVVRRFHLIPTTVPFGSLKGLGTFETRFMRAGQHVRSAFAVALFTNAGGKPWILERVETIGEADHRITQAHQLTGVPIAMR